MMINNDNKTNKLETKVIKTKKKPIGFFKFIKKYYKSFMPFFIGMIVVVFISSMLRIIQPKILSKLLDDIYSNNGEWWIWIVVMFVILLFIGIFTYLAGIVGGKLGKKIEIEVRKDTLNNLIKQDISYFSDKKSGETLTKVISDTSIVGDQAQRIPSQIFSAIFTMLGGTIVLFTIDVRLSIITILCTITIISVVFFSFSILRKRMMKVRRVITKINGEVIDKISSISLIKSSGTEERERDFFEKIHYKYYESNNKANNAISLMMTVMTAGIMSISTIVIMSAALMYHNDVKLFIILPSFLSGVTLMISPIIQMAQLSQGMAQASVSSTRLDELINSKTRIDLLEDNNKIHIDNLKGNIIFKNIVFEYPEKPGTTILPKTSFVFEEGKSYAFVGETGVGKSTISKLLLRYYDPLEGEILINDKINLKDVYMPSYLNKVGYVEQEPQILYGNIIDNISYGIDNVSKDDIIKACKKAKLDKVINEWPDKYETILGERGLTLSGGQKQRLVIARMFLKNPSLLIFDEATSALDNIVEAEISKELKELSKGKTTITIAHRLSTIKDVDKIIVLKKDEGIVEVGTFKELTSKKGYFKDLYNAGLMK